MGNKSDHSFKLSSILKAIAAVITAIALLLGALPPILSHFSTGSSSGGTTLPPTPTPISTQSPTSTPTQTITSTPTSIPLPEVKITNPRDRDEVNSSIKVLGTISGELPNGRSMWLVVNPEKSRGNWWPQGGRINPWKGQWDMQATFGGTQDIGTNFTIAVILVGEDDDKNLLEEVKKVNTSGIPLPYKAIVKDEIIVKKVGN